MTGWELRMCYVLLPFHPSCLSAHRTLLHHPCPPAGRFGLYGWLRMLMVSYFSNLVGALLLVSLLVGSRRELLDEAAWQSPAGVPLDERA